MKKLLVAFAMLSFSVSVSVSAFAAETAKTAAAPAKTEKTMKRKIASEEVKCAENANDGIGIDPDFIEKQIKTTTSCYEASHIVESCGAGSLIDVQTTDPAIKLCEKLTGKLSKGDADLRKRMLARCEKTCDPRSDGTLCASRQAFCRLDVAKFMNAVSHAED